MERSSDCSSPSESDDDDQFYDAATELLQHANKGGTKHQRLDDIFGNGEPVENIAKRIDGQSQEAAATGETDHGAGETDHGAGEMGSRTKVECDTTTEPVCHHQSDNAPESNFSPDTPHGAESPPEIKLKRCEKENNENSDVKDVSQQISDNINEPSDGAEESDDLSDEAIKEEALIKDELAARIEMEETLTQKEKLERKELAQQDKLKGNAFFKSQEYLEACNVYTTALELCPLTFKKERSIMYSNRAACRLRLEQLDEAISDCTEALTLNPLYMKALLRRAQTFELLEKLDESLADHQKALEMDPGCQEAQHACMRLPNLIKERNEKLKEEMMGKLKDLGNMVLRPFGLSTSNFQFNQDPNTGSYSMNFVQNAAGGNGK